MATASRANPEAMMPKAPQKTRTAPPMTAKGWYSQPRMRKYLLFDATGIMYLLLGFVALRVVWALGEGPEAWTALLEQLTNPGYIAFHAVGLLSVLYVGYEFFRRFPKSQPAKIGPAKPPPAPVLLAGLYVAWIGLTVVFVAILSGVLF